MSYHGIISTLSSFSYRYNNDDAKTPLRPLFLYTLQYDDAELNISFEELEGKIWQIINGVTDMVVYTQPFEKNDPMMKHAPLASSFVRLVNKSDKIENAVVGQPIIDRGEKADPKQRYMFIVSPPLKKIDSKEVVKTISVETPSFKSKYDYVLCNCRVVGKILGRKIGETPVMPLRLTSKVKNPEDKKEIENMISYAKTVENNIDRVASSGEATGYKFLLDGEICVVYYNSLLDKLMLYTNDTVPIQYRYMQLIRTRFQNA